MAYLTIYGVRSSWNCDARDVVWYRLESDAEKCCNRLNKEYPSLEYFIITSQVDDGEG